MVWICLLACVYACMFCVLRDFAVDCGFSALNENIMRFRWSMKSSALLHVFF